MAFSPKKNNDLPTSMRIGVYNPSTKRFFEHREHSNEGFVASFAYQSLGGSNLGFVYGGAYRSNSNKWTPAIHIVKQDLQENQQAQIEYTGSSQWYSDGAQKEYVDHLKIDETNLWVYGATRNTLQSSAGTTVAVFKIK